MDKFIQLPFTIPQSDSAGVTSFIGTLLPELPKTATTATSDGLTVAAANGTAPSAGPAVTAGARARAFFARIYPFGSRAITVPDGRRRETGGADADPGLVHLIEKQQADVQRELSLRLTDASGEIRAMLTKMAPGFSTNPREIKRLLNMARFYLLLRIGRIASGKQVPDIEQYERWIMLTLRWPDMTRWLQWGDADVGLGGGEPEKLGSVAGRLQRLEQQAEQSADFAAWNADIARRLGLLADEVSWLKDDNLFAFFKQEAAKEPKERISAGAQLGFF